MINLWDGNKRLIENMQALQLGSWRQFSHLLQHQEVLLASHSLSLAQSGPGLTCMWPGPGGSLPEQAQICFSQSHFIYLEKEIHSVHMINSYSITETGSMALVLKRPPASILFFFFSLQWGRSQILHIWEEMKVQCKRRTKQSWKLHDFMGFTKWKLCWESIWLRDQKQVLRWEHKGGF